MRRTGGLKIQGLPYDCYPTRLHLPGQGLVRPANEDCAHGGSSLCFCVRRSALCLPKLGLLASRSDSLSPCSGTFFHNMNWKEGCGGIGVSFFILGGEEKFGESCEKSASKHRGCKGS